MSDEMLIKKCLNIQKNKSDLRVASKVITIILPRACDKEESIGSLVCLLRLYADKVIVVDDGMRFGRQELPKKPEPMLLFMGIGKENVKLLRRA